ncbi:MAG: cytochrome c oxidase subunit II [Gemmataceae bacterium]
MGKLWSVFFGVSLLVMFVFTLAAPFYGWWLPEAVSSFAPQVDGLFYLILGLVGFFFVLTQVILVYAMWRFAGQPGRRSVYTHGNHRLEMLWTAIPGVILFGLALGQIAVWQNMKYQSQMPAPDVTLTVLGRQWEWRMRYPSDAARFHWPADADEAVIRDKRLAARGWAENPEYDDVHVANELHTYLGANTRVYVRTQDVIHSFTMPHMRVKQDMLPGKTIPLWFQPTRANTRFDATTGQLRPPASPADAWEIACQELCGGRHYAMRGRVYVHDSKESYEAWLAHTRQQQFRRLADSSSERK